MLLQDFEKIKVINDANDFQEALREFLNVILIVGKICNKAIFNIFARFC